MFRGKNSLCASLVIPRYSLGQPTVAVVLGIEAIIQRDVRDLARIRAFECAPTLARARCLTDCQPLNNSDLASPFQLSRPTIREYVTLLDFLRLEKKREIPYEEAMISWYDNVYKPLVETFRRLGILKRFPGCTKPFPLTL